MTGADHPLLLHAAQLRAALDAFDGVAPAIDQASDAIAAAISGGGKVLAAGNGGSAAEAQHLVGEFVGRLSADRERSALPAVALTADGATVTALANDYGFDQIFARQVAAVGRSGDALVVLSTSGASSNLVAAVEAARASGITTIGLLGATRRELHERCDVVIAAPAASTATIQECHVALIHVLVACVEDRLAAES
jgi:D-sedoheptulose 7-phosphate isomerase